MKNYLYLVLLISVVSCNQQKQNSQNNESIATVNIQQSGFKKQQLTSNKNEPQAVALKFYRWYLKNIYCKEFVESPDVILNADSVYVLDATNHKKFLKTSGYFSKDFYGNEVVAYKNCEDKLKLVNWKEVEQYPAEAVEGNECSFLHYKVWTNGQGEALNKAGIERYTIKGDKALVVIALADSTQAGIYSKPQVSMVKENGNWKISRIKVQFE